MPVYNTEEYIGDCLESIVSQSVRPSKVLVINNGSSDNSEKIIDDYTKHYSCIEKINIEHNNYAGRSRNIGIKMTNSRFIMFVDSDDLLAKDAIKKLSSKMDRETEFVFSPHIRFDNKYNATRRQYKFDSVITQEDMLFCKNRCMEPALWSKLFRTDFLRQQGPMPENFCFEDLAWFYVYSTNATKVAYCNYPSYYFRVRDSSQTHDLNRIMDTIKAEQYGRRNCNKKYLELVEYNIGYRIYLNMHSRSFYIEQWKQYLNEMWPALVNNPYMKKNQEVYDYLNNTMNDMQTGS